MKTAFLNSPSLLSAGGSSAASTLIPEHARTILVVDDHSILRELVCRMLLPFGYEVLTARDGEEAWRVISAAGGPKFDLLLTDYRMPGMCGDELAMRFHHAFPDAGIIIMSADSPKLPRAVQCEFLPKPFHMAALREKVLTALSAAMAE